MVIINNDEKITNIYNHLSKGILDAYVIMQADPSLKLKKNDTLSSFDNYFVSLILDTILSYRSLHAGEINFINNLCKYNDYFKDFKLSREEEPNDEFNHLIKDKAHKMIGDVPAFAMLCVMIDKNIENTLKSKEESFSSQYYNELKTVRDYLLDDHHVNEDNLYLLYDFFKIQKVIL